MKLGTAMGIVGKLSFEDGIRVIKEAGFDCVDYGIPCDEYRYNEGLFTLKDSEFERYFTAHASYMKSVGIEVSQVHAPFPTYTYEAPEQFDYMVDAICRSLTAARLVGSPYLVVHCAMRRGWHTDDCPEETREMNARVFEKLLPASREQGVKIALENMPGRGVPTGTPESMTEYIKMMNSDFLVACLDTGHANFSGFTPASFARSLGDCLEVLHVHDNNGKSDAHMTPYTGLGTIDWDDFAVALRDIGYDGVFSLEANNPFYGKYPVDLIDAGVRYSYNTARHITDKIKAAE